MTLVTKAVQHFDSWLNAVTGLGTNIDKVTQGTIQASQSLLPQTINALLKSDDLARKIVYALPTDALAKGHTLIGTEMSKAEWDDYGSLLMRKAEELSLDAKVSQAASMARAYGGALLIMGTIEEDWSQAIGTEEITNLLVVNRHDAEPKKAEVNPSHSEFGTPSIYTINFRTISGTIPAKEVHASRCIRFNGTPTDEDTKISNRGWDDGVLQEAYDTLRQFHQIWAATANTMLDWSQAIFKLQGLIGLIGAKGEASIMNRMRIINMARSTGRAVVVDAEKESFSRDNIQFGGVGSILELWMMRVSSIVDMPVSKLFGRSAAGMNATGEMDLALWDGAVDKYRGAEITPGLAAFYKHLLTTKEFRTVPNTFTITYPQARKPSDKDQATTELLVAQKDALMIDREVLEPAEVALARYTDRGFSLETTIDRDKKKLELEPLELPAASGGSTPEIELSKVVLTPSTQEAIVSANEGRQSLRLKDLDNKEEGKLSIIAYKALQLAKQTALGKAAAAEETKEKEPIEMPEAAPPVPSVNPFAPKPKPDTEPDKD